MTDNHELQKTVNQLQQALDQVDQHDDDVTVRVDIDVQTIKNIHGWLTELKNIRSTEL